MIQQNQIITQRRGSLQQDRVRALAAGLEAAGWEIRDLDLDLVVGRVTVEIHRFDGRWVRLHADELGRTSIERWHRTISLGRGRVVGRVAMSPQVGDTFLGRTRCEGPRAGLRSLCTYVADNPAPGRAALSAPAVRALFAPLMGVSA